MSKNQFWSGSAKLEVVRSHLPTGTREKESEGVEAKKGNYLFGYSLMPSWLFVIVLRF